MTLTLLCLLLAYFCHRPQKVFVYDLGFAIQINHVTYAIDIFDKSKKRAVGWLSHNYALIIALFNLFHLTDFIKRVVWRKMSTCAAHLIRVFALWPRERSVLLLFAIKRENYVEFALIQRVSEFFSSHISPKDTFSRDALSPFLKSLNYALHVAWFLSFWFATVQAL